MKPQHLQQPKFSHVMNNIKANYAPIIALAFTVSLEQTSYKCMLNI